MTTALLAAGWRRELSSKSIVGLDDFRANKHKGSFGHQWPVTSHNFNSTAVPEPSSRQLRAACAREETKKHRRPERPKGSGLLH